MPEFMVREIYQVAAQELSEVPALPMEELFNNGVAQYRIGTIISDAAVKSKEQFISEATPQPVRLTKRWSDAIWRSLNCLA
jgi:hypothetical protein